MAARGIRCSSMPWCSIVRGRRSADRRRRCRLADAPVGNSGSRGLDPQGARAARADPPSQDGRLPRERPRPLRPVLARGPPLGPWRSSQLDHGSPGARPRRIGTGKGAVRGRITIGSARRCSSSSTPRQRKAVSSARAGPGAGGCGRGFTRVASDPDSPGGAGNASPRFRARGHVGRGGPEPRRRAPVRPPGTSIRRRSTWCAAAGIQGRRRAPGVRSRPARLVPPRRSRSPSRSRRGSPGLLGDTRERCSRAAWLRPLAHGRAAAPEAATVLLRACAQGRGCGRGASGAPAPRGPGSS